MSFLHKGSTFSKKIIPLLLFLQSKLLKVLLYPFFSFDPSLGLVTSPVSAQREKEAGGEESSSPGAGGEVEVILTAFLPNIVLDWLPMVRCNWYFVALSLKFDARVHS